MLRRSNKKIKHSNVVREIQEATPMEEEIPTRVVEIGKNPNGGQISSYVQAARGHN